MTNCIINNQTCQHCGNDCGCHNCIHDYFGECILQDNGNHPFDVDGYCSCWSCFYSDQHPSHLE